MKNRNNYQDVVKVRRRIYGELKSVGIISIDGKPLSSSKNKDLFVKYKEHFSLSDDSLKGLIKSLNIKNKIDKKSVVYFIGNEYHKFVKIGYSDDPTKRLKHLQVGCPFPIDILQTIETDTPRGLESKLHQIFRKQRCQGEWFTLEGLLVDVIKSDSPLQEALRR